MDVRKTRSPFRSLALGCAVAAVISAVPLEAQTSVASISSVSSALPPTAAAAMGTGEMRVFPLSEVRRGMQGVAYTVFEGVNPEPMQVEILGVLKDSLGPGQDMILARLHGTKPEFTGVVAGMSGSPVYVDGRLLGALSYRIGQFSKEPIAGITPIEQMLEVRDGEVRPAPAGGSKPQTASASSLPSGAANASGLEMQAMETPLVFSGFSPETIDRFGDRFRALGLTPVAGLGSADSKAAQPEPLVPGSAVSAILVRGDLSVAGTCTVTYVDPTRLLACGHPITQYGPVDMPMTKASVVATLPSPLNAFKIVNTTETVGAFTEDRASAVMGRFGAKARMIPVTVVVTQPAATASTSSRTRTFRFEVLDNRQLTPSAMLMSVYQSLQATNAAAAEMSYRLTGDIAVKGQQTVRMAALVTQSDLNPAAINAALFVNDRFSRVYGNALEQPIVTGMNLKLEGIPERRSAVIESARLGAIEAHAGETVEVEATLDPYQSEAHVVRFRFTVPADTAPGPVRLLVSDAANLDRLAHGGTPSRSVGLADTVAQINRIHANDRIYLTLLSKTAQAVLDGETMPSLPLSMANVLTPLKDAQRLQLSGESLVEAASVATEYAVSGSQVLNLMIR
jgi:hypothetical protein